MSLIRVAATPSHTYTEMSTQGDATHLHGEMDVLDSNGRWNRILDD